MYSPTNWHRDSTSGFPLHALQSASSNSNAKWLVNAIKPHPRESAFGRRRLQQPQIDEQFQRQSASLPFHSCNRHSSRDSQRHPVPAASPSSSSRRLKLLVVKPRPPRLLQRHHARPTRPNIIISGEKVLHTFHYVVHPQHARQQPPNSSCKHFKNFRVEPPQPPLSNSNNFGIS